MALGSSDGGHSRCLWYLREVDPRLVAAANAKRAKRRVDGETIDTFVGGDGSLSAALGIDTDEIDILRQQGLALLDAGRTFDAIKVLEALLALGDDDPGVRFLLSNAYRETGDLEVAVAHFSHGLELANGPEHAAMREAALGWGRHLIEAVKAS